MKAPRARKKTKLGKKPSAPPPKSKGGRPTIFTPALGAEIAALIEAGNYAETAAAVSGISKDTLYRWLKKGARQLRISKREGTPPTDLAKWSGAVELAAAVSESNDVARIGAAARASWQAAAWRLERKHPERWARRPVQKHEVSGPGGKPLEVKVKPHVPDPAHVTAVLDILRRAGAAPVDGRDPGGGPGGAAAEVLDPRADAAPGSVPPATAP